MTVTRLGQITGEMRCIEEFFQIMPSGQPTISSTQANTGTYSVKRDSSYQSFGIGFPAKASVRVGLWYYVTAAGFPTSNIMYLTSPGTNTFNVFGVNGNLLTQTLSFYADGVNVDSVVNSDFDINKWMHFAMVYDGPNGYLQMWLNSTLIYNQQGATFTYQSVNGAWSGTAAILGSDTYTDDMYVDEVTGADRFETPPRKRFYFKSVAGPGTYDDWTVVNESANWRAVDESTAHNGDTDYNKALSGSLSDTFSLNSISLPTSTESLTYIPRAVIPQAIVKRNNVAQDAGIRMLSYDGATLDYGDTESYMGPDYQLYWHRYTEQPDNSAWNETDINNMEFGYMSQGTFT